MTLVIADFLKTFSDHRLISNSSYCLLQQFRLCTSKTKHFECFCCWIVLFSLSFCLSLSFCIRSVYSSISLSVSGLVLWPCDFILFYFFLTEWLSCGKNWRKFPSKQIKKEHKVHLYSFVVCNPNLHSDFPAQSQRNKTTHVFWKRR